MKYNNTFCYTLLPVPSLAPSNPSHVPLQANGVFSIYYFCYTEIYECVCVYKYVNTTY